MLLNFSSQHVKILYFLFISSLVFSACNQSNQNATPTQFVTEVNVEETEPAPPVSDGSDFVFLSIEENGFAHLFIYHPQNYPLTRITTGEWNDIAPVLNPSRTKLAFASDRTGFWDLYVMNLQTAELTQITNSNEYDSAPSWSPDGQFLAFETYRNENLEIAVVNVDSGEVIQLTQHSASDHSPAWAPDGRHVAFISSRGGDSDVWLADLDVAGEERYQNLSNTPFASENYPVWNFDGSQLLWSSISQTIGFSGLYIWNADEPNRSASWIGDGFIGTWNESANQIIAVVSAPNEYFITSYDLEGNVLQTSFPLSGRVRGLTWGSAELSNPLPDSFEQASETNLLPLWSPIVTPGAEVPGQRWYVVDVEDIQAPYPRLHDLVDESFNTLRTRVIIETGWDALASLENAFVPLTTNLEPGLGEDWLYTGRAFAVNSLMSNAGWMVTLREDIGAQTYWILDRYHIFSLCVWMGKIAVPSKLENILQRCKIFYICINEWINLVCGNARTISSRSIDYTNACICSHTDSNSNAYIYTYKTPNSYAAYDVYSIIYTDCFANAIYYTYTANCDSVE
jgi:hypothetical protein